MATMRYFSDWNGQSVLLKGITTMLNKDFAARFPDVKGMRSDGYSRYAGWADDGSGVVSQKRCPQSQFVVFEQLTASDRSNGVSGIAQERKSHGIFICIDSWCNVFSTVSDRCCHVGGA